MINLPQDNQRDSWATIRGFVYQIRITVLRWLELDSTTVLFCECDEDISRIRQRLGSVAESDQVEKLLEQVKHRQKPVTLVSQEVIETLANFHAARQRDSDCLVLLRYTTNAPVGREQRFTFPNGMSGIEAWQRVANGAAGATETGATLAAFRGIICAAKARKSRSKSGKRLSSLQSFVAGASDADLLDFFKAVDWAVSQRPHHLLQSAIEGELTRQGIASPRNVQLAAAKLVVAALDTLSQRGLKRLDRALLLACLQDFQLSTAESALFSQLQKLEERLALLPDIASDVRETKGMVRRISDRLGISPSDLTPAGLLQGSAPVISAQLSPPTLDRPPLPPCPYVDRTGLLDTLALDLDGRFWLHLMGGAGMGKTHLARTLAERVGSDPPLWVSLTGTTDEAALLAHIESQIVAWVCAVSGDYSWWPAYCAGKLAIEQLLEAALSRHPQGALVVLDNLPDPIGTSRVWAVIPRLVLACRSARARVITTGQRGLSLEALAPLSPSWVAQVPVPAMSEADTLVLLQLAGAPAAVANPNFVSFLTAATHGHPSILAATVHWCAAKGWRFGEGEVTALFAGDASADVRDSALRQMVRIIVNDAAREMLCRLSLIGRRFDRRQLEAVATVEPELARPGELLLELVGPWVNQIDDATWEVSPLLSSSGAKMLATEAQRAVHHALAHSILATASVGLLDAVQAVVHLMLAQSWAEGAGLIIHVLSSVRGKPEAAAVWPLVLVFPPCRPWPEDIPLVQRILVRAFQIKVWCLDGRDADDLQEDLDGLIESGGDDPDARRASLAALLNAGPLLPEAPPAIAARRALQAARLLRTCPELGEGIPPFALSWEEFILFPMARVTNVTEGWAILEVLHEMTADELHAAFDSDLATQFLDVMVDRCRDATRSLPEVERDWRPVRNLLGDLISFGVTTRLERIETVARCVDAATLADFMGRRGDALTVLEALQPSDPVCRLLRHQAMACILFDMGRFAECIEHLDLGRRTVVSGFASQVFGSYALAAEACGRQRQWRQAASWAVEGIRYANSHRLMPDDFLACMGAERTGPCGLAGKRQLLLMPFVQDLNRLELTGDLALAFWYGGDRKRACGAMVGLVRGLCAAWNPGDARYREVFRKTGHVLGWLSSISTAGAPPAATAEGGEYAAPWLGVFIRHREELADIATPLSRPLLCYLLGIMAAGVGLRSTALTALRRAAHIAAVEEEPFYYRHTILLDLAVAAAMLGLFEESLDAGLEAVRLFPAAAECAKQQDNGPVASLNPDDVWECLPQAHRCAAQEELLWLTFGPAILNALLSVRDPGTIVRWRSALCERKDAICNPEYWDLVLDAAQMALAPAGSSEVFSQWSLLSPDAAALCQMLCFALSEAAGARLGDVVCAQSLLLVRMEQRRAITKVIFGDFSAYVMSYWARVAATRAPELRLASQFAERVEAVSSRRDLAAACQVLLWAEEASGATIPEEMRQKIQDVAQGIPADSVTES